MRYPLRMIAIKPGTSAEPRGEARKPPDIPRPELYSTRHSNTRAWFRRLLNRQLQVVSGKPSAEMHYTADNYLEKVVVGARAQLIGWPAGIPFGNASDLKGGSAVLEHLLRELVSGRLYFRRLSRRRAREVAQNRITPGMCLPRPPRRGRSDVKVHRLRTVKMARYPLTGPKTPVIVEESESESEIGQWESDEEEEDEAEMSDRVEQWTEDEGQ